MGGGQNLLNAINNYGGSINAVRNPTKFKTTNKKAKDNFQDAAETLKYSYGVEIGTNYSTFETNIDSNGGIYEDLKEGIRKGTELSKGAGITDGVEEGYAFPSITITKEQTTSEIILDQFFRKESGNLDGIEGATKEMMQGLVDDKNPPPVLTQEKIKTYANWVVKGDPITLEEEDQKERLKTEINKPTYAINIGKEKWDKIVDCLYDNKCEKDKNKPGSVYNDTQTFLKKNKVKHEEYIAERKAREKAIRDRKEFLSTRKTIAGLIDIGVKWLWDNYVKDLGTLDGLRDIWEPAGEASDRFNEYINSDSWKNSMCNPESGFAYGWMHGGSDKIDDVLECTDTMCRPVISMAMEKAEYNQTLDGETDHYIYTLVYYVGPAKQDYEYNINFYYGNGESHCVYQDDEGECLGDELIAGEAGKDSTEMAIAFTSANDYKKICIEFNKPFPSVESQGVSSGYPKTKYCRNIVDSAFFTGDPDLEYDETTGTVGGATSTPIFG